MVMKASEIRIGIHIIDVFNPNNPIERQIDFDDLAMLKNYKNHPLPFKPIPLTEEWLLKFVFVRRGITSNLGKLTLHHKEAMYPNGRVYFNSWAILEKIPDYVHQLQNLYFALTNEELTLKQK